MKTSPLNVAVFVSGRGSNLEALLQARAAGKLAEVQFSVVFSDVSDPPAFDHACRFNVPTLHLLPKAFKTKRDYEFALVANLHEKKIDLIVLAGYMRIVGPTLLAAYPDRIINIHPSLLPAFPGLHAQRQAIEYGVKVAGCTVHFVDGTVDGGPVILQRMAPCYLYDTEESLSKRILAEEHQALPQALEWIAEGRLSIQGRRVHISGTPHTP